jgi:hypothetical protein
VNGKLKTKILLLQIMATLNETLAAVNAARVDIAKIRVENSQLRLFLETTIKTLQDIISAGAADADTVAALGTAVAGLRDDLAAFDSDVPDAPA